MHAHGSDPWRFGAADYQTALGTAPSPGRRLRGAAVAASWDAALTAAMRTALQVIDEEMVADPLLQDLTSTSS